MLETIFFFGILIFNHSRMHCFGGTGALSSVWREWVNWLVEFGIEPDAIVAVPYDWRLPGAMLEERDLYFHKLK